MFFPKVATSRQPYQKFSNDLAWISAKS